jgi:hypothetical protein
LASVIGFSKRCGVLAVMSLAIACGTNRGFEVNKKSYKLLSTYEDSVGHLLKTRELSVYSDGSVIEERYDWTTDPPVHISTTRKKLTPQQLQTIAAAFSALRICALPEHIPSARSWVSLDAPFRAISWYGTPSTCRVQWDSPYDRSLETTRFGELWALVVATINRITGA